MGQCQFTYRLQVPAATLLEQIQQLAKEFEGELQGDEQAGQFSLSLLIGRIVGQYTVHEEQLQLTITAKPFWVGCDTIDATIRNYLSALA